MDPQPDTSDGTTLAELSGNLIVRGETVQTLYSSYVASGFVVNRRYQRKLVWSTNEKADFIDSLAKQFPVPLILTAERVIDGALRLEIIDGLQRLNSIFAFLENEYPIAGKYFDVETLAETKFLRDKEILTQRQPILDRRDCVRIANYVVPISTYRTPDDSIIEEVFRRINANGRYLSRQEIRQAGATSNFSDLVREVSCFVRGDASIRTSVQLTKMPEISITDDLNGRGVYIETIFWIRHKILEKDQVRESRDEEIVADLLASMILDSMPRYASETLDQYYGLVNTKERRSDRIEAALQREDPESVKLRFQYIHSEIEKVLTISGKNFVQLFFKRTRQRVPRYYSTLFLAMFELLIARNRQIGDYKNFANALDGIGDRVMKITGGGGTWSAENKRDNVAAVAGVLEEFTVPVTGGRDVLLEANESKVDRLLQAALAEHGLFELKQGLHRLDESANLDKDRVDRILETVSAIANDGPNAVGYLILGVADKKKDADRVQALYGIQPVNVRGFYITGIDHEFKHHGHDLDGYQIFLKEQLTNSDLDDELRSQVLRDLRPVRFHGRTVILATIKALNRPVAYKNKWFERQGPSTEEIATRDIGRLFSRFPAIS
ncbi:Protein of uncharacterised function DUF262 [Nocardia farcinica]|uniref:Protein of uncharacterized function DUF262 n=1 Tax=Nocardia farcinica TaxID=37329 RepID=A0A449H3Q0_NOCFR|nr:Protein of uncharacterised function DUF262 [Nocardia farcinica]